MQSSLSADDAVAPAFPLARLSAFIYWAALAIVLLLGATYRFGLPQEPFLDGDTWGYLNPAITKLTTGAFEHTYGRDSLYPGFVYVLLKLTGDFRAIAVTQHLLGLFSGVLMALAWDGFCRLLLALPANRKLPLPWRLAGLLPLTAYLNSNLTLQYEHSLRPEAVFPFFVILSLWLNFVFIRRRWFDPAARAPLTVLLGAAALVVSIVLYKLKPSFGFGVLIADLPVLVSLVRPGIGWPWKTLMAGGAALFSLLALILPESALKKNDPFSKIFLPDTLLTIHADMIADQIGKDLASNAPSPFSPQLVTSVHDRLKELLPISRRPENHPYVSLGFNPDYLLYTDNPYTPAVLWTPDGWRQRAQFGFYYYRRTALHQPGRMLGKIARQMAIYYRFGINTKNSSFGSVNAPVSKHYVANVNFLQGDQVANDTRKYLPINRFLAESQRLAAVRQRIPNRRFSNYVQAQLCQFYLPGLLLTLGLSGWALWDKSRRQQWLAPLCITLLVFGYNFGNNLTIAIVHSLEINRYIANELAFTMFASAVGITFVGNSVFRFLPVGKALAPMLEGIKSLAAWSGGAMAPALFRPAPSAPPPTLCVLIPCYNEAVGVGQVVAEYRQAFPDARLLVVDNASSDGTAEAARGAGAEVLHEPGRGKARAILSGLSVVDSDLVLMVDGDGSYPAEGGLRLVASYLEAPADLITGVRFSDEAASGSFRPLHQGGTQIFGGVIGLFFGWRSEDVFSGLRLFSRRFYQNVPILSRGFELELELTVQAVDKGFSLRELAVPFGQRAAGTVSKLRTVQDGTRILRALFVLFRDFRPLLCFGAVSVVLTFLGLLAGSVPIEDYVTTRYVSHLPLAVLAASLMILAALAMQTGLVLESGLRRSRESYQLQLRREARFAAASGINARRSSQSGGHN